MTPEAQRIAIAGACGWKRDGEWSGFPRWQTPKGERFGGINDPLRCVPDYVNDLNAMHEAEKVLGPKWTLYQDWLIEFTKHIRPREPMWHSTAAQRAEAFLRTLGLWKEVSPVPEALHDSTATN